MKFNIQKTIYTRPIFVVSQKSILKFDNSLHLQIFKFSEKFQTSYDAQCTIWALNVINDVTSH